MFNDNNCLVITGCISPVKQKYLLLTNVKERLSQYIISIRYYIKFSNFTKIVFCENSNYNYKEKEKLYSLASKLGKNFEWISFKGNSYKTRTQGKGYGEGEILQYALDNSILLKKSTYFTKVTGRLLIKNINAILSHIDFKSDEIFINVDIYRKKGLDTRFYVVDKKLYKTFYSFLYKKTKMEAPGALEDLFFLESKKHNKKCQNLPFYPRFIGSSGGNGRDYSLESPKKLFLFDILCKMKIFNKFTSMYYYQMRISEIIKNTLKS